MNKALAYCTNQSCEYADCKRLGVDCRQDIDAKFACQEGSLFVRGDLKLEGTKDTKEDKNGSEDK